MSFVPRQEPDRVPGAKISWIAATSVVITAASVVIAVLIVHAGTKHAVLYATAPPPPPVGTVERTLIATTARGLSERDAARRDLERFGWADRDGGVARIPIDRAMDLYVSRSGR